MKIRSLKARKVLNSKREPAIEIIVNRKYVASAPEGTSKGKHEVKAFQKGIDFAVRFVNKFDGLNGFVVCFFISTAKTQRQGNNVK